MAQCTLSIPSAVCVTTNFFLNPHAVPIGTPTLGTFSGTGVTNVGTNYYFDAATAGIGGPYVITYSITTPFACTTTANIYVRDYLKTAVAGTATSAKYTMVSGTTLTLTVLNPGDYSNFHWYENGFEVGTSSSLAVYRMGTFTVFADGPCGTHEKAEVEVVCDCSVGQLFTNHTFLASSNAHTISTSNTAWHANTDFVFEGTITVAKGATLNINHANIDMKPCTKIILEKGDVSTPGGILNVGTNVHLRGCDKWLGIIVNGDIDYPKGSNYKAHLTIASQDARVSDAYIAVYSENGGDVTLTNGTYSNNSSDIVLMANHGTSTWYDYEPEITNDTFLGVWMHDDFSCSLDDYSEFTGSTNKSNYKKMIYLEDCKDFNICDCFFTGNDFLSGNNFITNAIEISHVDKVNLGGTTSPGPVYNSINFAGFFNSGIYGRNVSNTGYVNNSPFYSHNANYMFDRYFFNEDIVLNKAIDLENCSTIYLGYVQASPGNANQFLGTMNYGVHVTNSANILQYENIFNVANVASTTGLSSNIGMAMKYVNCNDIEIHGNWMAEIDDGGYFENCINNCDIEANQFYDLDDGLKFKDCDNITIEGNTFDNITNYSLQYYGIGGSKSYIEGNRFIDGNYALIISPSVNPIGTGSSSNDNGTPMSIDITCNLFENNNKAIVGSGDIITQGSGSLTNGNKFDGNNDWDLCWMDFDVTWFEWYESGNIGADPSVTGSAITLNGTSISSSNYTPAPNKSDLGCFSSLRLAQATSISNPYFLETKLVNSLVTNELKIITKELRTTSADVTCFDALGRTYNLESIVVDNGFYSFNTKHLAPGIYYVTLNNSTMKFYKL